MLPPPIEHRFRLDGEPYCLVEWTRGGEKRLRADYAAALVAQAPDLVASLERPEVARDPLRAAERLGATARQLSILLEGLDGADLYAEAVARECLTEAPEIFWESRPAPGGSNGASLRVVTLERVPRRLWELFRQEVTAFLALIFPAVSAAPADLSGTGPDESLSVAVAETLSPVLRGRAE